MTKNGFDFLIETDLDFKHHLQQQQIDIFGEDTCYKIFSSPRDVSHKYYKKLFDDFEWFKEPTHETTLDDLS